MLVKQFGELRLFLYRRIITAPSKAGSPLIMGETERAGADEAAQKHPQLVREAVSSVARAHWSESGWTGIGIREVRRLGAYRAEAAIPSSELIFT